MSARFWWRVREWWHTPSSMRTCMKPCTFWDEWNYYHIAWLKRDVRSAAKTARRHSWALVVRVYWALRWYSQIRCNGNLGGWRTRFCEWLEDQARAARTRNDV